MKGGNNSKLLGSSRIGSQIHDLRWAALLVSRGKEEKRDGVVGVVEDSKGRVVSLKLARG